MRGAFPSGPMGVGLVDVGTELTGADYAGGLRMPDPGTLFTSYTAPGTLDVTGAVRSEYLAGRPRASFRLRFLPGWDTDAEDDVVTVVGPVFDRDEPMLEVEYRIP